MGARRTVVRMSEQSLVGDLQEAGAADLTADLTVGAVLPTGNAVEIDFGRIYAEADQFFADIDVNGDGSITVDELRAHLGSYADIAVNSIFELLDVNSDGGISAAELREAFVRYEDPSLRLALGLGTAEADRIFDRIDADGDGELTKAELVAFLEAGGFPLQPGAADTIFATLDANGDGSISRAELRDGYVRYSSLREALGLGGKAPMGKNPRGAPIRLGRGRKKGDGLVAPPQRPDDDDLLTIEERDRLQPIQALKRVREQRASPRDISNL